jgi:hypothetical protein
MKKTITILAVILLVGLGTTWVQAQGHDVPTNHATIQAAINAAPDGCTINIVSGGPYVENVIINKPLTLNGAGQSTTIIAPTSGIAITVTANTVTIQNLGILGGVGTLTTHGIWANGVSALTIQNVTVTGCKGSGIALRAVTGGSWVTNVTATGNKNHGLEIGNGSTGVHVSGGDFLGNGTDGNRITGSGIMVYADASTSTNGTVIDGTVDANTNTLAGIYLYCDATGNLDNTLIGQSGTVTLNDNGTSTNGGAALVIYGPCDGTTVTANSVRSLPHQAAGLVAVGTDASGSNSPTNTTFTNCDISGFGGTSPAATMYVTEGANTLICTSDIDAKVGNDLNHLGAGAAGFAVENLLYHKIDNVVLGRFLGPGTEIFVPTGCSINNGIACGDANYVTVNVQDGSYNENVIVNKVVTLNGQGANTIINPTAGAPIDVTTGDVVLQNLGIYLTSPLSFTMEPTCLNNTFIFAINAKVFLQGPFSGGTMSTTLNDGELIPSNQVYTGAPFNYAGTESVVSIPANVVDWVLVELRSTATGAAIAQRAAFLRNDGVIVETDGTTGCYTSLALTTGHNIEKYIVIKHRNHLAVMSAAAVVLPNNSSAYDFTTGTAKYYGDAAAGLTGGVYGLFAGDINNDASVDALDFTIYKSTQGNEGYEQADFTFDASVDALDFTLYKQNQGQECGMVW